MDILQAGHDRMMYGVKRRKQKSTYDHSLPSTMAMVRMPARLSVSISRVLLQCKIA